MDVVSRASDFLLFEVRGIPPQRSVTSMGLLGTFIHSLILNTLTPPTSTTYNHSLGQQPDLCLPHVTSLVAATAYPEVLTYSVNASIATVVALTPSTAT